MFMPVHRKSDGTALIVNFDFVVWLRPREQGGTAISFKGGGEVIVKEDCTNLYHLLRKTDV